MIDAVHSETRPGPSVTDVAGSPVDRSAPTERVLLLGILYSSLLLLLSITAYGIAVTGSKYVFKDQLGLRADRVSLLTLLFDASLYVSFLFGLLRDRWRPFGPYDRLLLVACPAASAACTLWAGFAAPTIVSLAALLTIHSTAAVAVNVVLTGQLAAISKHLGITGRVGALMNLIPFVANAGLGALTGYLMQRHGWKVVCIVSAIVSLTVVLSAFWQPRRLLQAVYRSAPILSVERNQERLGAAIRRLASNRAVLICTLISALWCFAPGWGTPLFFHFTDDLMFSEARFELTQTTEKIVNGAASLCYLFLCLRFPARSLLYFGIGVGVPGAIAYAFVHDYRSALLVSAWYGASCGIGNAAVNDLVFRVTPRHLEAVAAMLATAAMCFCIDVSDFVGSLLYNHGGFLAALAATTAINVLIFPLIALVPSRVFSQREGVPIDDAVGPRDAN